MEVVRLDGYTEDEKVAIARDHLLPRQLERAGLTAEEVTVDDDALRTLAAEYTREAGVRELERELARLLRKVAARRRVGNRRRPRRWTATCATCRPAAVHARVGRAHGGARRGHRPGRDRCRRRRALRRGIAGRSGEARPG